MIFLIKKEIQKAILSTGLFISYFKRVINKQAHRAVLFNFLEWMATHFNSIHLSKKGVQLLIGAGEQKVTSLASLLTRTSLVLINEIQLSTSKQKPFTMDALTAIWEMNLESDQFSEVREEIASWPTEPYTIDWDSLNWN